MKTRTFEELIVWQKAHQLALEIYKVTRKFPKEETYGLTSQIRRSAVSVAANIAEGYRRKSKKEKTYFLSISEGSVDEVKYYLILSRDLKYLDKEFSELFSLAVEVSKLLTAYKRAILTSDS